jgi:hypothetical protein
MVVTPMYFYGDTPISMLYVPLQPAWGAFGGRVTKKCLAERWMEIDFSPKRVR